MENDIPIKVLKGSEDIEESAYQVFTIIQNIYNHILYR